jgi:CBS domain-containing protein
VLVRDRSSDPPRIGIFTHTGLQRAILTGTPLHGCLFAGWPTSR